MGHDANLEIRTATAELLEKTARPARITRTTEYGHMGVLEAAGAPFLAAHDGTSRGCRSARPAQGPL